MFYMNYVFVVDVIVVSVGAEKLSGVKARSVKSQPDQPPTSPRSDELDLSKRAQQ